MWLLMCGGRSERNIDYSTGTFCFQRAATCQQHTASLSVSHSAVAFSTRCSGKSMERSRFDRYDNQTLWADRVVRSFWRTKFG